jgi:very-short-patch-repair endonuclease
MNLPERVLWRVLRKLDLHVRRQAPIGRYIADFTCHEVGLVIEVDGYPHTLSERQQRDLVRDDWLRSQGYRVLRFRDQQVLENLDDVMEVISESLPPRWGRGRDGGGRAEGSERVLEALTPSESVLQGAASTPTQPSPLEEEGALYAERSS